MSYTQEQKDRMVIVKAENEKRWLDLYRTWLAAETVSDMDAREPGKRLYDSYVAWCEANGRRPHKITEWGGRMSLLVEKKRIAGRIYYLGIRIGKEPEI